MNTSLLVMVLLVSQPEPAAKISLCIVPEAPVADDKTGFTVEAKVVDAKGKPIADAPVRFTAEGYAVSDDGMIVGRYEDMKRGVDYKRLNAGGFWDGKADAGVAGGIEARTNKEGIVRILYKAPPWVGFMAKIPTRVTAEYRGKAAIDVQFKQPKK